MRCRCIWIKHNVHTPQQRQTTVMALDLHFSTHRSTIVLETPVNWVAVTAIMEVCCRFYAQISMNGIGDRRIIRRYVDDLSNGKFPACIFQPIWFHCIWELSNTVSIGGLSFVRVEHINGASCFANHAHHYVMLLVKIYSVVAECHGHCWAPGNWPFNATRVQFVSCEPLLISTKMSFGGE